MSLNHYVAIHGITDFLMDYTVRVKIHLNELLNLFQ